MKKLTKSEIYYILVPVLTVLISSLMSWLISNGAVKRAAVSDLQREVLQNDAPVLNKISDISSESRLLVISYIENQMTREVRITTYMNLDGTVASQDTTYTVYPTSDTSYFCVPRFVYYKDSYSKVVSCFQYVEAHVDGLSLKTYNEVNDLLLFLKKHPIVMVASKKEVLDCEWAKPEVYTVFIEKVEKINQSYLKRLERFGLE